MHGAFILVLLPPPLVVIGFVVVFMSAKSVNGPRGKKPASAATNLIGIKFRLPIICCSSNICVTAGGGAGMMEALVCHPLGTMCKQALRPTVLTFRRYHQGPDAAITARQSTRGKLSPTIEARTLLMVTDRQNGVAS